MERKDGEPISCVTKRQAELLQGAANIIPVTTRSVEQYRRIDFAGIGFSPRYALCDNGGTLIANGELDAEWSRWSSEIFKSCEEELERFRELLDNDPKRSFEVRLVDGLFLFTKSSEPSETLEYLGKSERCECFATGEKVYVIPKELSKGAAVRRLAKRLGLREFAAAGDSLMDVPMLSEANVALFPEDIAGALPKVARPKGLPKDARPKCPKVRHTHKRDGFPEFVAEFADRL